MLGKRSKTSLYVCVCVILIQIGEDSIIFAVNITPDNF